MTALSSNSTLPVVNISPHIKFIHTPVPAVDISACLCPLFKKPAIKHVPVGQFFHKTSFDAEKIIDHFKIIKNFKSLPLV